VLEPALRRNRRVVRSFDEADYIIRIHRQAVV
jgi:hypothetical protein